MAEPVKGITVKNITQPTMVANKFMAMAYSKLVWREYLINSYKKEDSTAIATKRNKVCNKTVLKGTIEVIIKMKQGSYSVGETTGVISYLRSVVWL